MDEVEKISKKSFLLKKLHYQYVKTAYNKKFWNDNMSLPNSPHVEIMKIFLEYGFDWNKLKDTRYVSQRKYRREIGRYRWTDEYIKEFHLKRRYRVFKLVKKKNKKWGKPIRVLERPFWLSRFMEAPEWVKAPEIWDGGGRCAAMYVLGKEKINAIVCKDINPGSKYWKKIQKELQ